MTGTVARPNWKKLIIQTLSGAFVGAASTSAVLLAWDDLGSSDPAQLLAVVTGLIYALMGLVVGVGAFAPSAGVHFLNCEDAEELLDQRVILGLSSAACIVIGLLFFVLALVPAGGASSLFGRDVAAALAAACLIALIILTRLTSRRADELTRLLSLEASTLAMQVSFLMLGGWAALAHLGFAEWGSPLALVSAMACIMLLAVFWVTAKRGLMIPRDSTSPRPV